MSDVWRTLRVARDEHRAVGVELEGLHAWRGAAVRVVAGGTALSVPFAAGLVPASGPLAVVGDAVALALVLLVVLRPRAGWCAWLLLLAGATVLLDAPGAGRLAALLLAVHLAVLASLLAARVGWGTRVEVAVPLRMLRRAWPAQLAAQAAGLVVWLLRTGGGLPGGELWRVLALVAAIVLVLLVLPARRRG